MLLTALRSFATLDFGVPSPRRPLPSIAKSLILRLLGRGGESGNPAFDRGISEVRISPLSLASWLVSLALRASRSATDSASYTGQPTRTSAKQKPRLHLPLVRTDPASTKTAASESDRP